MPDTGDMTPSNQPIQARFLPQEGRPRMETITLDWPFTYGDHTIKVLEVHRLSVAQVERIVEGLKGNSDISLAEAMTTLPGGEPVPAGLFAAGVMDDDDDVRLYEVVQSFLPRRLQRVLGSIPGSGAATSLPSQAD